MKQLKTTILTLTLLTLCSAVKAQIKLSQEECRQRAVAYSEELQKSSNKLSQAQIDKKMTATAFLPTVDAMAMGIYMTPIPIDMDMTMMGMSMAMEMRMNGAYLAGLTLTQPIYTGGKILTGRKMAKIGEEAAREQQKISKMQVIVEADNAYYTYLAVTRKVQMMQSYSQQMDTLYNQVKTALSVGMSTENELLRIRAKQSEIKYQLQKVQNGADLCRISLCRVIGEEFNTQIELTDTTFITTTPHNLSADISERPELSLLQKSVDINREQIKMVRSDMLPMIALSAGYTYIGNMKTEGNINMGGAMLPISNEFKEGIGSAMLGISIPILHWGDGFRKVRKAKFELQNAELDLKKNSRLLTLEAEQAMRNLQDSYMMITTATLALQQAKENLRVTTNRYNESMAPLTDLLDAQSQWQQSYSNYIEAQSQHKIYETEYLRATGKLQ